MTRRPRASRMVANSQRRRCSSRRQPGRRKSMSSHPAVLQRRINNSRRSSSAIPIQGDQRVRRVDGRDARRDSEPPESRRADRRDHPRVAGPRRSHQAGDGRRRNARRSRAVADRDGACVPARRNRTSARSTPSSARCCRPNRSAIPTAPAASIFVPSSSRASASPIRSKAKSKVVEAYERVGDAVARGDVEIGFQQISELRPVPGITIVGPLPEGAQQVTIFSAAIPKGAKNADAARRLIQFLSSPAVAPLSSRRASSRSRAAR